MDNLVTAKQQHSIFWWVIKVLGGAVLIGGLVWRFVVSNQAPALLLEVPLFLSQALVLTGGGLYIWHYMLLKAANPQLAQPAIMVSAKGLYGLVRHPMYFADIICYAGLASFWLNSLSIVIFAISCIAVVKQSQVEDAYVKQRFRDDYPQWSNRTWLLVPYMY